MAKKRVLSGIRASGRLHVGNYLGAVKGMLELQNSEEYETLYMVADAHALTTPYDVEALRVNRREVIIDYLACGLDPDKSVLFQQADVVEHFELMFYFSSVVTIARMQHLPTFKDKVKQYPDRATMALLNYPLLMAADILIYKADAVPVGVDQEPHLEVSREVARKMNAEYGLDFPEPVRFATKGEYVPSLLGEGKMGKSVEGSFINLTDDLKTVQSKVAKIPTDSGKGEIFEADKKLKLAKKYVANGEKKDSLGVGALMQFVELFMGKKHRRDVEKAYVGEGVRYGDLKRELAKAIYAELEPLQEKRRKLESKSKYVDQVIAEGAEKARVIARQTVAEVKYGLGLK